MTNSVVKRKNEMLNANPFFISYNYSYFLRLPFVLSCVFCGNLSCQLMCRLLVIALYVCVYVCACVGVLAE